MEPTITTIITIIFTGANGAFFANYFMKKRNKDKEFFDLREEVIQLKTEAVRESHVKQLIEEAIRPTMKGIGEIKELVKTMAGDMKEMQLENARREGAEEALANKNKK